MIIKPKYAYVKDGKALDSYHQHLQPRDYPQLHIRPYDVNWMGTFSVSEDVLSTFQSKHKLSALISAGVLRAGDYIFHVNPSGVYKAAMIVPKLMMQSFPDLHFRLNGVPVGYMTKCTGPSNIVDALNMFPPQNELYRNDAWKILKVFRNGQVLGTLYDIRQRYGYFRMLMEAWEGDKGARYRPKVRKA